MHNSDNCLILLQVGVDQLRPPPVLPREQLPPLLTIFAPRKPNEDKPSADDEVRPRGCAPHQERPAALHVPRIDLPQAFLDLRPLRLCLVAAVERRLSPGAGVVCLARRVELVAAAGNGPYRMLDQSCRQAAFKCRLQRSGAMREDAWGVRVGLIQVLRDGEGIREGDPRCGVVYGREGVVG